MSGRKGPCKDHSNKLSPPLAPRRSAPKNWTRLLSDSRIVKKIRVMETGNKFKAPALPLFDEKPEQPPCPKAAWLQEVYVALPTEQAKALDHWCQQLGANYGWSDVVRLLVRTFNHAKLTDVQGLGALEQRLEALLRGSP